MADNQAARLDEPRTTPWYFLFVTGALYCAADDAARSVTIQEPSEVPPLSDVHTDLGEGPADTTEPKQDAEAALQPRDEDEAAAEQRAPSETRTEVSVKKAGAN